MSNSDLRSLIRDVPDFPSPGILFKDITPLLRDPEAFTAALDAMKEPWTGSEIDLVAAIESRGFIFGTGLAERLNCGLVPVRKPGKLPFSTVSWEYDLEYGTDTLQIHTDAIPSGSRVLIVDDVLATGGTAAAAANLVREVGGTVAGISVLIELDPLGGRNRLGDLELRSVIRYS